MFVVVVGLLFIRLLRPAAIGGHDKYDRTWLEISFI